MNIAIISPHPDDETLGAGGTILKWMDEGHKVYWINVTDMINPKKFREESMRKRKVQIQNIEKFYSFEQTYHLGLPSTELEQIDSSDAIDLFAEIFNKIKPEMVILPDFNDVHSDHKKVFDWCLACTKVFRFPYVKKIMTMEIVSETDFGRPETPYTPNYFVDITNYLEKKIEAMKLYDTEIAEPPFPRSEEHIRALATVRGATAGVRFAESFRLIKWIEG